MIQRLDLLTVEQFINLLCGDMAVISEKDEKLSDISFTIGMRNLVFEYKEIADPAGMKSYLNEIEALLKAKISTVVFSMCSNLINLNEYNRVRVILTEYGINTDKMTDVRIEAEVRSRLARAQKTVRDIESERKDKGIDESDIRKEFDAQTAALMAYFKFQIDPSIMKVSVYAHLIARHTKEIKAQLAAINKK